MFVLIRQDVESQIQRFVGQREGLRVESIDLSSWKECGGH